MSVNVVLVILLASVVLLWLELRRRRAAEARLHDTLASIEQQVADRTAALSKAMAELKLSEQNELRLNQLKDEFLATASHELRTPLNAIVGWVHVLKSDAPLTDEQRRRAVDAIDRNARIQTRLIEDLLDVSRMIQGRVSLTVSPLDLRGVLNEAVETVRHAAAAKDVALTVQMPEEAVPLIGDEHRLQQVLWNLLANSVKYTAEHGRIEASLTCEAGRAIVRVADSGEGIEPSFLPHVFEPFRQGASATMRSGLGLGLAIVRRLVDLHGGRITAESGGAGKGATFTVSLPLAT